MGHQPSAAPWVVVEQPMRQFLKKLKRIDKSGVTVDMPHWWKLAREFVKLKNDLIEQRRLGNTHLPASLPKPPMSKVSVVMRPCVPRPADHALVRQFVDGRREIVHANPGRGTWKCNFCHRDTPDIVQLDGGWMACPSCVANGNVRNPEPEMLPDTEFDQLMTRLDEQIDRLS